MSEILLAQNMSEVREPFSSGFLKPLEDMISSPKALDFFGSLKLNENWLNGFKSNLQSLSWILGEVESKAYVNKEVKVWLDELNEVSYDLEDLLGEIVTEELSDHQDKPRNIKIQNQGIFSAGLSLVEIEEITVKIENLQRQTLGLRPKASWIKREPCQLSVGRDCFEDESHLIGCPKLAKLPSVLFPQLAEVEISECPLLFPVRDDVQLHDGNKMQFGSDDKVAGRPPIRPVMEEIQLPDSYGVQLKHESAIASQSLEHRTDVPTTSCSSPPELSKLSTESTLQKLPVMVEKQVHEGNSRKEKLLDRPSTSRLSEVEELKLPDINVVQSTDVSITSNRPPPESPTRFTEDSSAKHVGASDYSSDYSSAATEFSSDTDTDTDDPNNDESDKAQFRRNEKLLDRPSTSRLQEIEELQLPDSNVVQSTDASVTSNRPTQESPTPLTEDSSAKHEGALDTSSAATEISSVTDTDTDDAINVSEISQLKRLPRKLFSLKIESCKALESLTEELMSVNLQQLYIIDCQYLKSIQASHLPFALKTLYIRRCKKLEFLSAEETTGKHSSVEHLCIESSCDPLKSFPLALFPKLSNLSISDCANFNSISITEDHNTLNSLEIRDCKNLESLWKSGLGTPKLTSILLSNCKKLKQLPGQLHRLTSLQSLFMKECPELDSIPVGGLPSSLNLLRISSCHKLTPCLQWGLHQLNKFIRFEIEGGCRDLESFPEQNLLPRNLNSLQISRFPNLKVLNYEGLQHLTSLQTLKINSCDKLQFLPEEGLPSSLSYLYISDCPLLKSKLQNRRGSEWFKIAHIPHIQIDGKLYFWLLDAYYFPGKLRRAFGSDLSSIRGFLTSAFGSGLSSVKGFGSRHRSFGSDLPSDRDFDAISILPTDDRFSKRVTRSSKSNPSSARTVRPNSSSARDFGSRRRSFGSDLSSDRDFDAISILPTDDSFSKRVTRSSKSNPSSARIVRPNSSSARDFGSHRRSFGSDLSSDRDFDAISILPTVDSYSKRVTRSSKSNPSFARTIRPNSSSARDFGLHPRSFGSDLSSSVVANLNPVKLQAAAILDCAKRLLN
ncbi:hypothetical protein Q3G72_008078 [Acer saccharum]|nr:hypothetical protein Q3G72_008078 [Acer saccharum]